MRQQQQQQHHPRVGRRAFAVASVVAVLLLQSCEYGTPVHAFAPPSASVRRHAAVRASSSSTALHMASSPRRSVLNWFRRAVMTAGVLTTSGVQQPSPSSAEEAAAGAQQALSGPVVEFQMSNLDGEDGSSGTVKIQLYPEWAPRGVDRFMELTKVGFWDGCRVFRVLPNFVVQFGINGDPAVQSRWRSANLQDDPVRASNERGTVVFATAGPNSRTSQIFINTREQGNGFLDKQGFAPIGRVIEGMEVVDRCYAGYGEGAPSGKGPNQALIQQRGNTYLRDSYPKLTFISTAKVV
jgi:peptidyl-prolyl cis-trans isomerase A (cyclophilin A)